MRPAVIRGDAHHLPLPDASIDLVVTSPPYFALRDYRDGDASLAGQIGSEPTPAAYIDTLVECTREWMRVLKPGGSMFVDLGDKYNSAAGGGGNLAEWSAAEYGNGSGADYRRRKGSAVRRYPSKSLLLLPERYRIACVDQLGLIARAVLIWNKPNGLPESVTDRVRRSHEDWVHLVKQPRYFAAVDEIREPHLHATNGAVFGGKKSVGQGIARYGANTYDGQNPLGKLPGSVWTIATEPLQIPAGIDADHFAAYPTEWPRRLILGWSPSGVCTACGEGRRPMVSKDPMYLAARAAAQRQREIEGYATGAGYKHGRQSTAGVMSAISNGVIRENATITGYACACTPYTDHPETGEWAGPNLTDDGYAIFGDGNRHNDLRNRPKTGPWREYHFDRWTPAPTRPAVVLDPFGGTGTTAHAAAALGRIGITVDLSGGYSAKLAASPELYDRRRRKVLGLDPPPKPEPQIAGQLGFFDEESA